MLKQDYGIRETYKDYKKEKSNPVSLQTYCKIVNLFMLFIFKKVFEGYEVTLPCRMGSILVRGTKVKNVINEEGKINLAPNWKKTKELRDRDPKAAEQRKIVYCMNEHTGGVIYQLHWKKFNVPIINKHIISFRATRKNKRHLHYLITKENKEYLISKEK